MIRPILLVSAVVAATWAGFLAFLTLVREIPGVDIAQPVADRGDNGLV